jgi:hypothetical protein
MALRSKTRAARFLSGSSSSSSTVSVLPGKGQPFADEYLVSFAIGTPPQPVKMTLDTGSDLIWTQCQPCVACYDQALPYFDMSNSSTFVPFPCNSSTCRQLPWPSCNRTCVYTYLYADMSVTNGLLAADTFTFDGGAAVDGLAFGCGFFNQGLLDFNSSGTGIAGFGRGALSLTSQLKVDNFSYCFTNITGSTPSAVLLGLPANLYGGGGATVQTTPLNMTSTSSYYLNLQSIRVGSTTLQVPASTFALKDDGLTGGTIIDSGTSITLLPPPVYSLLRDAFVSQLNMTPVNVTSLPDVLCFPASTKTAMPKLQLQFEGATLDLPQENYVFRQDNNTCIAIESSGGDITIIGNYQQQNLHVLYDLAGNMLSFVPAQCDKVHGLAGNALSFAPAHQCNKVCSIASRHAVLHVCGCACSLYLFLSIAIVFVLIKLY